MQLRKALTGVASACTLVAAFATARADDASAAATAPDEGQPRRRAPSWVQPLVAPIDPEKLAAIRPQDGDQPAEEKPAAAAGIVLFAVRRR